VTPRWRFRTIDSVCEAGYAVNDDVGTALDHAAWVLDGTTGHHPVRLFPGPSDAAWFAATADDLLRRLADTPEDGCALLQRLVSELIEACRRSALTPLDDGEVDEPAASLALARVHGDQLEIIMLGDCKLLLRRRDGTVEALDHSKVAPFDAKVVEALRALQAAGETDPARIAPRLRKLILANRRLKNRPGGYGVLADDPACIDFAEIGHRSAADLTHILLASDGFYRLVDTYHVYSHERLLHAALADGLAPLYATLRRIEDADPQCLHSPRLKARDDATALLLALERPRAL
jgi:serine/threonine protein phosphatase PrpC